MAFFWWTLYGHSDQNENVQGNLRVKYVPCPRGSTCNFFSSDAAKIAHVRAYKPNVYRVPLCTGAVTGVDWFGNVLSEIDLFNTRTTPAQIIKFDAILILRYYPGRRYFGILRYYTGRGYFGVSFRGCWASA